MLELLKWFRNPKAEKYMGLVWALIMTLLNFFRNIVNQQASVCYTKASLYYMNVMRGMVFDKVRMTPPAARKHINVGKISNFLTSDTQKIQMSALLMHQLISCPFVIFLYSILCIVELNWVGIFIPIILGIVMTFCITYLAGKTLTYFRKKLMLSDKRAKKVNEAVVGVKVIKLNAWEHVIEKIIGKWRLLEKSTIREVMV